MQPEMDDYWTTDYKSFRYVGTNRLACSVGEGESWMEVVRKQMEKDGYWPNVWYVGERGDHNLLNLKTGEFV